MQFDHVGVPTTDEKNWSSYLEDGKLHITDCAADPYRVEWLKFEPESPMPEELKTMIHVAYFVDNLEKEIAGKKVVIEPFSPFAGLTCAFIMHENLLLELMQKG